MGPVFFRQALVVAPSAPLGSRDLTCAAWLKIDPPSLNVYSGLFLELTPLFGDAMPNTIKGSFHACKICGSPVWRTPSAIRRNIHQTCGNKACISALMSGANNPFWGKTHNADTRKIISERRIAAAPKGTGPKKGIFKQTERAKQRIAENTRKYWADPEHRKARIEALIAAWEPFKMPPEFRRHRLHFTPWQRDEWKDTECAFCETKDELVLDHIIPIFDGGTNDRPNCQTLCQPCNVWKTWKIDLPRWRSAQAAKGAEVNPE